MIKKFRKFRAVTAVVMLAVMFLGALAVPVLEVRADTPTAPVLPQPTIVIAGSSVIFTIGLTPHDAGVAILFVDGVESARTGIGSNTTTGSFDLSNIALAAPIQVGLATADGLIFGPRSSSVNWTPQQQQLSTPTNIQVNNNILTWNVVPNAASYRILINGVFNQNVAVTQFAIPANLLIPGSTITFAIIAEAAGFTESAAGILTWQVPNAATLPAPNLQINSEGVLSWNVINNALGYGVFRVGDSIPVWQNNNPNTTTADLRTITGLPVGNQQFFVRAIASVTGNLTTWGNESNRVNWTVVSGQTLNAPTNLSISGTTLSWNAVPNAFSYRIYVGGTARTTITGTSFNLATLNLTNANHSIQVRTLGNGSTTLNSVLSNAVTFNPNTAQLATPTISINNNGILTWTGGGNHNVRVYVGNTFQWTSNGRVSQVNLMQIPNLPTGNNQVRIRHLHDTNANLHSAQSNQVNFNSANVQLATPSISINNAGILTWTGGGNHIVRVYSGNTVQWTSNGRVNQVNLTQIGLSAGNHQIRIRHLHETNNNLHSAQSNQVNFNNVNAQIATPNISINNNGILTWTGGGNHIVRVYLGNTIHWTSTTRVSQVNLMQIGLPEGTNNQIRIRHLHETNTNLHSAQSNQLNFNDTNIQRATPNISINSAGILTWEGGGSRNVRVYAGNTNIWTSNGRVNQVNLTQIPNLPAGNNQIRIRHLHSTNSNLHSAQSNQVNFNAATIQLATPNISISGTGILTWTGGGNHNVRVYVGNTFQWTSNGRVSQVNLMQIPNLPAGNNQVRIRHLHDTNANLHSAQSNQVNFNSANVQMAAPTISINNGVVTWEGGGAHRISVYANGQSQFTSAAAVTQIDLRTIVLPAGQNRIQIRHLHANQATLNSGLSNEVIFTVAAQPTPTPAPTPTPEQPSGWAVASVNTAIERGLVPQNLQSGYTQATTRAEFAALAVTLYESVMGVEITGRMNFNDTNDVNVQKAGYIGVVMGVGNGNFAPDAALNREQAAVMLARLADTIGRPLPQSSIAFADTDLISSWAVTQVGQMQASGIMEGMPGNVFAPRGPYQRQQSIVTILRLFDWLSNNQSVVLFTIE